MQASGLSAIILAGGKSTRMGIDKAFLNYGGNTFIEIIAEEMRRLSEDVLILIGTKSRAQFESFLGSDRFRIMNDTHYLDNPLGGVLTGLDHASSDYSAVVACDSPRIRSDVLNYLYRRARGHSAALPIWDIDNGMTIEPLCAVYNVEEMRYAIREATSKGKAGLKHAASFLGDVHHVPVSELRQFDQNLVSLLNINTKRDYFELLEEEGRSAVQSPSPELRVRI
jgi:molybdopterin-guanine dinucleotide biosynthesis protein A